jgi:endonuclease YncB( thermonuclease family)
MVRKGFAHVYTRFNFALKARFREAEDEAKRGRLGVWALPPGPWREVPDASR